jgi:hypothetical protein
LDLVQEEATHKDLEEFTPEQMRYIRWRAVPKSLREPPTTSEFASLLGVSTDRLKSWERDKDVRMAIFQECQALEGDRLPEVLEALTDRAVDGSIQAMKLYLQVHGYYKESDELDVNVKHQQLVVVLNDNEELNA